MKTEYAFILTGQWTPEQGSTQIFTFTGKHEIPSGMTRHGALKNIMAAAKRKYDIPEDARPYVLFFAFEPNRLGGV